MKKPRMFPSLTAINCFYAHPGSKYYRKISYSLPKGISMCISDILAFKGLSSNEDRYLYQNSPIVWRSKQKWNITKLLIKLFGACSLFLLTICGCGSSGSSSNSGEPNYSTGSINFMPDWSAFLDDPEADPCGSLNLHAIHSKVTSKP